MQLRWRRWLLLTHRWLGILMALMVAAWFSSGLVMLYVPYPELTTAERRAGQPALDFVSARLTPRAAAEQAEVGAETWPLALQLGMHLDRPVYRFSVNGYPIIVLADSGEIVAVDRRTASAVATDFHARRSGTPPPPVAAVERIEHDQWSLSGAFALHRPLYRVALADPAGSHYYVSSLTGEILLDTSRRERLFNYVGAVVHWLYPTVLRHNLTVWSWLVQILAALAVVMALAGLWLGWLQWQRKRPRGRRVPYRGLARWHYFAGVLFGVPALTWAFSGLLSMNPGNVNPWRSADAAEQAVLAGSPEQQKADHFDTLLQLPAGAVTARTFYVAGEPRLLVTHRDGRRAQLDATGAVIAGWERSARPGRQPAAAVSAATTTAALEQRVAALMPAYQAELEWLTAYDNYYKPRRHAADPKPLPVLRARFSDPEQSWFHVDPFTGEILDRLSATNRLHRWLYQGLHTWDLLWLAERRPLWDLLMLTLLTGGLTLSLLGVVLGYRRLVRR